MTERSGQPIDPTCPIHLRQCAISSNMKSPRHRGSAAPRNPPVIWALRWVPSIRSCKIVLNSAFHGIKPEPRSSFCSNPPLSPGAQPCSPPHWICSGGVESWAAVFSCWKFLLVLTEHLKTHNEGMEESLKKNPIWQHTIKAPSKEKRKIRT